MYPCWWLFLGFCLCHYWYACAQSTAEEKVEIGNDVILTCDLTGTFTQPKWEDPDNTVTFVGTGVDIFNSGESRTSRMTRIGTDKRNLNFVNLVATDTGRYMCSSTGLGTHTVTLTVSQSAQLGEACSTSPLIECVAANSSCTNSVCVCEDGFIQSNNVCGPPTTTTTITPTTTTTTMPPTTTTTPTMTTTTMPTTTTIMPTTTTTTPTTTITTMPTTTTTMPTTKTTEAVTTKTTTLTTTTTDSAESSSTTAANSNERTVIIVVASVVGGVVLVGLVVFFLGLFLYRARRPGHKSHKHSRKRNPSQQQSGIPYIYSGPNNSQNMKMYPRMASYMDTGHSYPRYTQEYPDRSLGVDHQKQANRRHEGIQMRSTNNVKSRYSVYPGNMIRSGNQQNFSPNFYPRHEERQRPATTDNIQSGHVNHAHQSGYTYYQSRDYSDNWNMY